MLGLQHFLSMFGGTVLVPLLTGFSPSLSIMCSGIGTLLYQLATRGRIPSYLGPSFAVVAPIVLASAVCSHGELLSGVIVTGLVILIIALIIDRVGIGWINRLFPPYLVSCFVIVIGLGLCATAMGMALEEDGGFSSRSLVVAAVTLAAVVACSAATTSFISCISVLLGVVAGYGFAACVGMIDLTPVAEAPWLGLPQLTAPQFSPLAIALIAPIALVLVADHIGHLFVVSEVTGSNLTPLLGKSLLGDALATIASGFLGGLPTSTFAENMGVMSATRVYSAQVFRYAGALALLIGGLCPKLEALIGTIPDAVVGGVSIVVFGLIVTSGLKVLLRNRDALASGRKSAIACLVLVVGVGMTTLDAVIPLGNYALTGLMAAMVVGVTLNLALVRER